MVQKQHNGCLTAFEVAKTVPAEVAMPACHCEVQRWAIIDFVEDGCDKEAVRNCRCCRLPTCDEHLSLYVDGVERCAECATHKTPCFGGLEGAARERANRELADSLAWDCYQELRQAIPKIRTILEKNGFNTECLNIIDFSGRSAVIPGLGPETVLKLSWWIEDGYAGCYQVSAVLSETPGGPVGSGD